MIPQWILNYVKDNDLSYKLNLAERLQYISENFHLTKAKDNEIDLTVKQTTSLEEIYREMPFVLKDFNELYYINEQNASVIECLDSLTQVDKTVPIEWKFIDTSSNPSVGDNKFTFYNIKLNSGFTCFKTNIIFNVKPNFVLLCYVTTTHNEIICHSFGIDSIDNGIVHLSMFNPLDKNITCDVSFECFLFYTNMCEFGPKPDSLKLITKVSKIGNLAWTELNSLKLEREKHFTVINNQYINSQNLIFLPRKRAMMNEHFMSMGMMATTKKSKCTIHVEYKTTSPFTITNVMAVISVKGQFKLKLVEKDFEITSFKSILNGYYSNLANYKELTKSMEKLYKMKKVNTQINALVGKFIMGLNETKSEFIKASLKYFTKMKHIQQLKAIIEAINIKDDDELKSMINDELQMVEFLKSYLDVVRDYFVFSDQLQYKLDELSSKRTCVEGDDKNSIDYSEDGNSDALKRPYEDENENPKTKHIKLT